MAEFSITYDFEFPDQRKLTYVVALDADTLEPIAALPDSLPEWTALDVHKCSHCPLSSDTHPHCPLASRIVDIVHDFEEVTSFEEVDVRVETPERTISKKTTAQVGASALLGIVMATSGCPHTAHFKPMAAYHLPLANSGETVYRAASMYLFAQYYVKASGGEPDLSLDGLRNIYADMEVLNVHMAKRVRGAIRSDAAVNAIVILDFFAKSVTATLEEKLAELAPLFRTYTE